MSPLDGLFAPRTVAVLGASASRQVASPGLASIEINPLRATTDGTLVALDVSAVGTTEQEGST